MNLNALLNTAYLGPIQHFTKYLIYKNINIEQFENFPRQTFRNRCQIYTANGILSLSIPVKKVSHPKCLTKDITIDYSTNWQKDHLGAITSAYSHTAFFEYYIDELRFIFKQKQNYLLDLNQEIDEKIVKICQLKSPEISRTFEYTPTNQLVNIDDLRDRIHPKSNKKKEDSNFICPPYYQVFENRFGFVENLSIIDLLFNEGPNTTSYLKTCIRI